MIKARNGDSVAMDALIRRYTGFVRLKASSYFLAGGDNDDLLQEGLIGLYKAVRDFRTDKETSFRSFAELCSLGDVGAENVAGRDLGDTIGGHQGLRLCPFANAGRA